MTKNSTAGKLIDWAGGEMAVDGEKGMTLLSPEVIAKSDPDIILLTDFATTDWARPKKLATYPEFPAPALLRREKSTEWKNTIWFILVRERVRI